MASLRKRHSIENEPPVTTPPQTAAAQPPPEAEDNAVPSEPVRIDEPSPVKQAETAALKQRLAEVQRAETLARTATQQQPRAATEPPQQAIEMPAAVKTWLDAHPQYMDTNDVVAQAEIHLATVKTLRDGKSWHSPDFLSTLEHHLAFREPQTRPEQVRPAANQPIQPRYVEAAPARTPAPQQRPAAPVSAPPTREVPSMTSGRALNAPMRLTPEEQQLARTLGLSDNQYMDGKKRMMAEKAAGLHDGR